jgi:uncharacterized protein (TIGR03437 family)
LTAPTAFSGELPDFSAPVVLPVKVWLDEQMLPAYLLRYVGLAPGFAGLYQLNIELPGELAAESPEIRIEIDGHSSQGIRIAVEN